MRGEPECNREMGEHQSRTEIKIRMKKSKNEEEGGVKESEKESERSDR